MVALYRRYRPESFSEVVGQAAVTEPLSNALRTNRVHHAYLFSGPRGCGKTTSARIMARCLNCHEGPTDNPCGTCPSCLELSRDGGGSLDVVEIDAASHNGVDDARELRERAVFAPARDRFKIFILDEAHMVTQQGFNALLKIVEEPPEHVKFIFATTEPEKVLSTIRSRTHHYPFRLVPPAELLNFLEAICDLENVGVEEGVLALVVRSGGGSVRDTLSVLDQLMAGSSESLIRLDDTQALLGYTSNAILDAMMSSLAQRQSGKAFQTLEHMIETGQEPRRFAQDFLSHIRDVLVLQAAGSESKELFPGASDDSFSAWKEQSTWFSPSELSFMAETVSSALSEMSGVTSPKLQLELLIANLLANTPSQAGEQSDEVTPPQFHNLDDQLVNASGRPSVGASQAKSSEASGHLEVHRSEGNSVTDWDLGSLKKQWPEIIESLSSSKRSLWVAMKGTRPLSISDDVLTIGFPRVSDAEILKKPQGPGSPLPNADLLREVIFERTGRRARFTVSETPPEHSSAAREIQDSSEWPKVAISSEGSSSDTDGLEEQSRGDIDESENAEPNEVDSTPAQTSPIATRGEPIVRQLLGGELVGEEVLEEMSSQGEIDV